jgi:hypothetical protein
MSVLAEFLNREATRLAAERPTREAEVGEWRAAVEALFGQLTDWIKAADPNGVASVSVGQITLRERRLGVYTVPTLTVEVDGEAVVFVPKSRGVGGGVVSDGEGRFRYPKAGDPPTAEVELNGRVDVMSGVTAVANLYRLAGGWVVWQPRAFDPAEGRFAPFTRERFENTLVLGLK